MLASRGGHSGRVQTRRGVSGDLHQGEIHHRNGSGDRGANHRVCNDFSAGRVDLEVVLRSSPAALVADLGGRAIAIDHDAVGRVPNADLLSLLPRLRSQVDSRERIVLV